MQERNLAADLSLPIVGLGTWQVFDLGPNEQSSTDRVVAAMLGAGARARRSALAEAEAVAVRC